MFDRLINLFKERKPKNSDSKHVSATSYPAKINIHTYDKVKAGYWPSKANVTILDISVSDEKLEEVIREHLSLTRYHLKDRTQSELKEQSKAFLKSHGFKTMKALHQNAKHLGVSADDKEIKLESSINGGSTGDNRGFRPVKDGSLLAHANISNAELGILVREAWELVGSYR